MDIAEREMKDELEGLMKEESWAPMEEAGARVLKSASELFGVIKKRLQQCTVHVSRGEAMLQLSKAFQVTLNLVLVIGLQF